MKNANGINLPLGKDIYCTVGVRNVLIKAIYIKVPKRENMELAFLHSVNPSDLGTEAKNRIFIILVLISIDCGFYRMLSVRRKKI